MTPSGKVGPAARALGFAGLLPSLGALLLIFVGQRDPTDLAWIPLMVGYGLALVYGAVILSFLGGIWWGLAMRRAEEQAPLAVAAVVPSLIGVACVAAADLEMPELSGWPAVVLGSAVMLTLPVDRHLVSTGEAPIGWTGLRVPLSLGLGLLTIACGIAISLR